MRVSLKVSIMTWSYKPNNVVIIQRIEVVVILSGSSLFIECCVFTCVEIPMSIKPLES